jgi:hypothetical protein
MPDREGVHHDPRPVYWKRAHRDGWFWTGLVLTLTVITLYVLRGSENAAHGGGGEKAQFVAGRSHRCRGEEATGAIWPQRDRGEEDQSLLKFLSYFWGPIPWMIEAAVILSGVVRHWPDFFIILLLLVCNAVVGFWEERQAGNAIAALKKDWRSVPR